MKMKILEKTSKSSHIREMIRHQLKEVQDENDPWKAYQVTCLFPGHRMETIVRIYKVKPVNVSTLVKKELNATQERIMKQIEEDSSRVL